MFWHPVISFTFPLTSQYIEELLRYFHNLIMRHIHNCIFLQNFMTSNSPNHSRMFDKLHNKNFKEQLSDALNSNNYSTKSSKDAKPIKMNHQFIDQQDFSGRIIRQLERSKWRHSDRVNVILSHTNLVKSSPPNSELTSNNEECLIN